MQKSNPCLRMGAILRAARESLRPEELGLPQRGRSRTPGLRREDVAELAGISETYYAWLEQGRVERPSERVIKRVARALKLDPVSERELLALALGFDPAPESFSIIACERLAAFLDDYAERCWHYQSFAEVHKTLFEGLHQPQQLTFFEQISDGVVTISDCRGPNASILRAMTVEFGSFDDGIAKLEAGEVVAISDLAASNETAELARTTGMRSVISVAIRLGAGTMWVFGYAEPNPRTHGAIEQHLLRTLGSIARRTLNGSTMLKACEIRRGLSLISAQ